MNESSHSGGIGMRSGGGFGSLLEEASREAKEETIAMNLPEGSIVRQVMEFLRALDDDETFVELNEFEEKCLPAFEGDKGGKNEDYKLEYHDMHQQFCLILERKLERFVAHHGYTVKGFYSEVKDSLEKYEESDYGSEILRFIHMASSFPEWANSMRCMQKLRELGIDCRKTLRGTNISSI